MGILLIIKKLQAQYLVIKVRRPRYITYSDCNSGDFLNGHAFSLFARRSSPSNASSSTIFSSF